MARLEINPAIGEEIVCRLSSTDKVARNLVAQNYMEMFGWSRSTFYRVARNHGFRGFSQGRSDKGEKKIAKEIIEQAAAVVFQSKRKTEKVLTSTRKAIEYLEDNGILSPGQIAASTMNRYFREMKVDRQSLLSPSPHVTLRSRHPNHVQQIDASVCVQYDFKDKGTKWKMIDREMKKMYYKNKPQFFKQIKKILIRYIITDHLSDVIYPRYYYVRGEDTATLVDFVWNAWAPKPDPHLFPFEGVPKILMMDKGSANISAAFNVLLTNLKIQPIVHEPGNPRANGQVEEAHNFWEKEFESELSLEKAVDIEDLNARAYDRAIKLNAILIHDRLGCPRFEAWMKIQKDDLRFLPCEEIFKKLIQGKEFTAVADGAKQIRIDGKTYEVRGEVRRGMRLKIVPDFHNPAQFKVEDQEGKEYPALEIYKDQFGFPQNAPVIGESFKKHAFDATQRFIADVEKKKIDTSHIKPQMQRPKVESLHYLQRPGVPVLGKVDREIPAYSAYEARKMVRERLGVDRITPIQAQLLDRYLKDQMSEEEIGQAVEAMRRHVGKTDEGMRGDGDEGQKIARAQMEVRPR